MSNYRVPGGRRKADPEPRPGTSRLDSDLIPVAQLAPGGSNSSSAICHDYPRRREMRLMMLVCWSMLIAPGALAGQRAKWTGSLDAGYAKGLGDAFSGQGAFSAHLAGYRSVGPTGALGLELGYTRFS